MRKATEDFLWSYGLTPRYLGFYYIGEILEQALDNQFILQNMFDIIAKEHEVSRSSVYQSVSLALARMDLSEAFPGSRRDRIYYKIRFLVKKLEEKVQAQELQTK